MLPQICGQFIIQQIVWKLRSLVFRSRLHRLHVAPAMTADALIQGYRHLMQLSGLRSYQFYLANFMEDMLVYLVWYEIHNYNTILCSHDLSLTRAKPCLSVGRSCRSPRAAPTTLQGWG